MIYILILVAPRSSEWQERPTAAAAASRCGPGRAGPTSPARAAAAAAQGRRHGRRRQPATGILARAVLEASPGSASWSAAGWPSPAIGVRARQGTGLRA